MKILYEEIMGNVKEINRESYSISFYKTMAKTIATNETLEKMKNVKVLKDIFELDIPGTTLLWFFYNKVNDKTWPNQNVIWLIHIKCFMKNNLNEFNHDAYSKDLIKDLKKMITTDFSHLLDSFE
jgi:hypothetical protein